MMNWGETIRLAFWALKADKIKAFLTMLGVVIGSAAIVLVVTIASTGKTYIISQIEGIGANLAYAMLDRNAAPVIPADELGLDDLLHIRSELPSVVAAAGTYDNPIDFTLHGRRMRARLVGVTEEFQTIRNLMILSGRYFDGEDFSSRARVCLITPHIAKSVFEFDSPVGRSLEVAQFRCTIIGEFKEGVPTFGQSEIQQDTVLVPFPLIKTMVGDDFFQVIYAQASSPADVPIITAEVARILQNRHRKQARYNVENLNSVLETARSVSLALRLVLIAVAALTLVTAGSGIMNIMLVNIAQRKNEIGLRKALGARPLEIRLQFLMEALFISFGGAILGVAVALALTWFVTGFLEGAIALHTSWMGVLSALLLSTGVGALFGYRPASAAANLHPVEALRAD